MEQNVFAEERQVDVLEAVVVVVRNGNALPPTAPAHTGPVSHVGKHPAPIPTIQTQAGCRGLVTDCGAVREQQVERTVRVVVEERHAGARRFEDVGVALAAAEDDLVGQPGRPCNIDEGGTVEPRGKLDCHTEDC